MTKRHILHVLRGANRAKLTGSAHADSCLGSQRLCDELYRLMSKAVPGLERAQTKKWCAYYEPGRSRFAYVRHRLSVAGLEIWCRGDTAMLDKQPGIVFRERAVIPDAGGWEKTFPGRFEVVAHDDVPAAARCLVRVAYPASRAL
jgi:hypothetical protein